MADYTSTVELKANTRKLESSMRDVTVKIDKMGTKLKGASTQFRRTANTGVGSLRKLDKKVTGTTKIIRTMTAAFSAVAVTMFVSKSLQEFAKLEDGLKQIGTLGVKNLKGVEKAVFKTAKAFGTDVNAATKGYYDIISAGASSAAAASDQLTAAAKLAKAGNTDLGKSVDILTTAINVFGDNGETSSTIIDKLFTTVKLGKTTVAELGQSFGLVAATADAAGVSLAETGSALAVMTAGGLSTSTAVTGLKAALSNIIKVTPKAEKAAKALGIEFTQASLASKGFVAFFEDIRKKTGGSVVELGKLFDSVEAINAVATMTSDVGIKKLANAMDQMQNSAGTVERAWETVADSLSVLFARVSNTMLEASHSITELIVGPLKSLLKGILENSEGFRTFKKVIVGATGAAVALLAVFAVSKFKAITVGVMSLTRALMLNPLFLIGGAAGFAVVELFERFGGFTEGFTTAINRMQVVYENWLAGFKTNSVFVAFTANLDKLHDTFKKTIGIAFGYVSNLDWDAAWHGLGHFSESVAGITKSALEFLQEPIKDAYDVLSAIDWTVIWGDLAKDTQAVYDVLKVAYSEVAQPLVDVFDTIKAIDWSTMWGGLYEGTQQVLSWFLDMYIYLVGSSIVPDMVNEIGAWFTKLVDMVLIPVEEMYNGVVKLFDLMYTNITGTTRKSVNEVNSILADVHGPNDLDKGIFQGVLSASTIENLNEVWENLTTTFKVIGGLIIGIFSITILSKFSKTASKMFDTFRSSASTVSGKQGLVNRALYGKEGSSRAAMKNVAKLRKEVERLEGGQRIQKGEATGKGRFQSLGMQRASTLDKGVLKGQIANAEAEIKKLGAKAPGRGIMSRFLYGNGQNVTGFTQKFTLLTARVKSSLLSIGASVSKGIGFASRAIFGAAGSAAISTKFSAMVSGIKLKALGLRASLETRAISNHMLYGKGGVSGAILAGWTKFTTIIGKSKFKLLGVAAAGVAGMALYGATGGSEGITSKWESFLDSISFDKIKETALNAFSEYGTDGLIMWAMFGAPGSGALLGGITKAFAGMKGMLAKVLLPAIGYLATTGAGILSGPVGWIALGLAGAAAITYALWPKIEPMFTDMWNGVTSWFSGIDFSGLWDGLVSSITSPLQSIKSAIMSTFTFTSGKERTGNPAGLGRGLQKKADGGFIIGEGSATSDSIPAMLSNGEYVINAQSTKKHRKLLESLNKNRFSMGGYVGGYESGSGEAGPPRVQFTGGKFDHTKTLKAFGGFMDESSEEMRIFKDSLDVLSENTFRLTEEQINELSLVKQMNSMTAGLINTQKMQENAAKVGIVGTKETTKAVVTLGEKTKEAADKIENVWSGFGKTLTNDLKDSLSRADFSSVGDAIGSGIRSLAEKVSRTMLDRAFAPMEKGLDTWFQTMDTMEIEGSTMFARLGNMGSQMFSGMGSALSQAFSSMSGGGGFFSAIVGSLFGGTTGPKAGMTAYASGGRVAGPGSGTSDSIVARLSNGEFVVNAASAQANLGLLTQINGGFAKGGHVGEKKSGNKAIDFLSSLDDGIQGFVGKITNGISNAVSSVLPKRGKADEKKGESGGIMDFLKFLIPGAGIMEFMVDALAKARGPDGFFPDSTIGGLVPDFPTRKVMERGRGFEALNGGGLGGFSPNSMDFKRAESQRTSINSRLFTTSARKDQLGRLTTAQRAAFVSGTQQKDSRGRFKNANDVLSRISGGSMGESNAQRESKTIAQIKSGALSNFVSSSGSSIKGVTNSFDRSDSRLSNSVSKPKKVKTVSSNTGHPGAMAKGGMVGRPKNRIPKYASGGRVNTGGAGNDGPIYLTLNNNYDVQSAMNPAEFQAMLANNSELSFLSVEKKLRETGRSLYK